MSVKNGCYEEFDELKWFFLLCTQVSLLFWFFSVFLNSSLPQRLFAKKFILTRTTPLTARCEKWQGTYFDPRWPERSKVTLVSSVMTFTNMGQVRFHPEWIHVTTWYNWIVILYQCKKKTLSSVWLYLWDIPLRCHKMSISKFMQLGGVSAKSPACRIAHWLMLICKSNFLMTKTMDAMR